MRVAGVVLTVIVGMVVVPFACTPGINSADLILWSLPFVILAIAWPREPRPRRPVSRHYEPPSTWGVNSVDDE